MTLGSLWPSIRDTARQWARDLFATLGDDNDDVLAGLKSGRTIGRTTPPTRDATPNNEFRFS